MEVRKGRLEGATSQHVVLIPTFAEQSEQEQSERVLKVRITDIPKEGSHLEFDLDLETVNQRANPEQHAHSGSLHSAGAHQGEKSHKEARKEAPKVAPKEPREKVEWECRFEANPHTEMDLSIDGRTVRVDGLVSGDFVAPCARCTESTTTHLESSVDMVLKPDSARKREEPEDIDFGYYSGEEIDCGSLAEEALMLAIPYVVLCSEDCKGLCPQCGANLNQAPCACRKEEETKSSPFSVLKDMKILQ